MLLGSSAYGSVPYGGSTASEWFTLHDALVPDDNVQQIMEADVGPGVYEVVITQNEGTEQRHEFRLYSRSADGESPQLQSIVGGGLYNSQSVYTGRFLYITSDPLTAFSLPFGIKARRVI